MGRKNFICVPIPFLISAHKPVEFLTVSKRERVLFKFDSGSYFAPNELPTCFSLFD